MSESQSTSQVFTVANPNDPDAYAAGLPDKFTGTIGRVLAYPYKGKESKDGKYNFFVGVRIIPDADSGFDEFTSHYFGGNLNRGYPSKDGKTPAGGSHDDYMALAQGKGTVDPPCVEDTDKRHVIANHPNVGPYVLGQYAKNMSWDQFCEALSDCDEKGLLDKTNPRLDYCSGFRCRFDRISQKASEGKEKKAGDKDKDYKVLVPTQIIEVVKTGSAAKSQGVSATTSAASASTNGSGDLATVTTAAIKEYLAGKDPVLVGTIVNDVGNIVKKQGFKRAEVMAWIGQRDPNNKDIPVNLVDIDGTSFDIAGQTLELD